MNINNKFKLGDVVTLVVGDEEDQGMVTCIAVNIDNGLLYHVSWDSGLTQPYYGAELLLKMTQEDDWVQG